MKIIIAGDFTTEDRGEKAVFEDSAISDPIKQQFIKTDLTILNLEAPVANRKCPQIEKIGPCLSTPKETIAYLKSCGVDVLTLANNHFFDYGRKGVERTIQEIENTDLYYVGGGRTANEVNAILYLNICNERIAIINYCENEFSIQNGIGSNHLDAVSAFYDIQEAKKNADIVLVIVHGGHEYYQLPSPRMKKLYRYFIDLGATSVINHHQHCYSGFEIYKNSYIFYGLGNFFFDAKSIEGSWNEGYYVEFNINNHIINDCKLYPYIQCRNENTFVSLMSSEKEEKFKACLEKLNFIISDDIQLQKAFIEFCETKANGYTIDFSPYSNRYLKALCKRNFIPSFFSKKRKLVSLNHIQCESHRDIMLYALNYEKKI